MQRDRPRPTQVERTFHDDEIIVSKTDAKGIITYANDVFLRVSGYTERELVGQPHSIVRHPDMPRAVFKLLWDTLAGGQEIFAYVKNMASNGDYYWVLAHVTPSRDRHGRMTGYHSNRRTPYRDVLPMVTDLYQTLLQEERRHRDRRAGLAASCDLLRRTLAARGMDYEQFVFSLIPLEKTA